MSLKTLLQTAKPLCLLCETTGVHDSDQLSALAMARMDAETGVLLEQHLLMFPVADDKVELAAKFLHIPEHVFRDLAVSTVEDVAQLRLSLEADLLCTYNVDFQVRFLSQTPELYKQFSLPKLNLPGLYWCLKQGAQFDADTLSDLADDVYGRVFRQSGCGFNTIMKDIGINITDSKDKLEGLAHLWSECLNLAE